MRNTGTNGPKERQPGTFQSLKLDSEGDEAAIRKDYPAKQANEEI